MLIRILMVIVFVFSSLARATDCESPMAKAGRQEDTRSSSLLLTPTGLVRAVFTYLGNAQLPNHDSVTVQIALNGILNSRDFKRDPLSMVESLRKMNYKYPRDKVLDFLEGLIRTGKIARDTAPAIGKWKVSDSELTDVHPATPEMYHLRIRSGENAQALKKEVEQSGLHFVGSWLQHPDLLSGIEESRQIEIWDRLEAPILNRILSRNESEVVSFTHVKKVGPKVVPPVNIPPALLQPMPVE